MIFTSLIWKQGQKQYNWIFYSKGCAQYKKISPQVSTKAKSMGHSLVSLLTRSQLRTRVRLQSFMSFLTVESFYSSRNLWDFVLGFKFPAFLYMQIMSILIFLMCDKVFYTYDKKDTTICPCMIWSRGAPISYYTEANRCIFFDVSRCTSSDPVNGSLKTAS